VALVIGGSAELVQAVEEAAVSAQVLVAECAVSEATNTVASMRPLVMVMPDEVYSFDPESFEALARDVRSQVLTIPSEGLPLDQLRSRLEAVMLEAETQRQAWTEEHSG
jgi:hypothetical protein